MKNIFKGITYQHVIMAVVLILLLGIKIFFSFQETYPDYAAFVGINYGFDGYNEQSYQGRNHAVSYLYTAVLQIFSLVLPILTILKLGGILMMVGVMLVVYLIARKFYDETTALLIGLLGCLSPVIVTSYVNSFVPESVFMLLYALMLFTYFNKYTTGFLIFTVLALVTSPLTIIFVAGYILYLFLLRLESLSIPSRDFELGMFSLVLVLWYHLVTYKNVLFSYGTSAVLQTLPRTVLESSFQLLDPASATIYVGILPVLFGLYGVYATLFEKRKRAQLFLSTQLIIIGLALWLSLLPTQLGLVLSVPSAFILSGITLQKIRDIIKKSVLVKFRPLVWGVLIIVGIVSFLPIVQLNPQFFTDGPSEDTILVLREAQLSPRSTILAHIHEGHVIQAATPYANLYDENFLLAPEIEQRHDVATSIFRARSDAAIITQAQRYDITHILATPLLLSEYPEPQFTTSECFTPVYTRGESTLYEITCELKR